ncbi:M15 family metallopeptidase [Hydrogenibacillus schlegelii]|uniref:M15 family metallopeptidase n=1 Tax=Hydrogenibacillus schlegelii TaxID=1484 RepID=UPI0009EC2AB4|nr:M15 family metallopeptidase [Hydrogenibacillus schlegelii]
MYVREEVLKRLNLAADFLPEGYGLMVYDGWRSFEFQHELYEFYKKILAAHQDLQRHDVNLEQWLQRFVAPPIRDPDDPPPHTTGGAVDVTLIFAGAEVEMGTSFDDFTAESATDWYEQKSSLTPHERLIAEHRKILRSAMEKAGFVNYPLEWWHFDFGNLSWAKRLGREPLYGAIWNEKEAFGDVKEN